MFAIAPTDNDWFQKIQQQPHEKLVNFWKPTPRRMIKLKKGEHLYFMLKAPTRKIAGYGKFLGWREMTAKEAWNQYDFGNGVDSVDALVDKVEGYAEKRATNFVRTGNPRIGCIELSAITILPNLIAAEECGLEFSVKIVTIKHFNEKDRIEECARTLPKS